MMKTSQCIDNQGQRVALFPGSFDPFTCGHESIVRRALPLFDRFIIAIGVNADKRSFMTMEQRKAFIESVFKDDPRVQVITYSNMTVEIAQELGAQFIVRGVRLIQDFENEKHLAEVNRDLTGIETIVNDNAVADGIYTIAGVKTGKLQRGLNIVVRNGKALKIMVK